MNLAHVRQIVDAVLYEGYMLYPYRASGKVSPFSPLTSIGTIVLLPSFRVWR